MSSEDSTTPRGYLAVRRTAGRVDRSGRGLLEIRGADRASFLHALLTNDIAALVPGTGCYAAYLTPQGRMIADMIVLDVGDALWMAGAAVGPPLAARLDSVLFTEDVRITDVSGTWTQIGVHGPHAARVLPDVLTMCGEPHERGQVVGVRPHDSLRETEYSSAWVDIAGSPALVVRSSDFGVPGWDLFVRGDRPRADLVAALDRAGVEDVSAEAAEALRVEAGRPLFGRDMDAETIPLEAGLLDRAISLSKGCYVGQEVIIRILHRGGGRVARTLVGLEADALPSAGDAILAGGREVGGVTSAVLSPTLGRAIALGYVHRDAAGPGTPATIGRGIGARVVDLPFVRQV
jgi:folate-binding protein YgfZ